MRTGSGGLGVAQGLWTVAQASSPGQAPSKACVCRSVYTVPASDLGGQPGTYCSLGPSQGQDLGHLQSGVRVGLAPRKSGIWTQRHHVEAPGHMKPREPVEHGPQQCLLGRRPWLPQEKIVSFHGGSTSQLRADSLGPLVNCVTKCQLAQVGFKLSPALKAAVTSPALSLPASVGLGRAANAPGPPLAKSSPGPQSWASTGSQPCCGAESTGPGYVTQEKQDAHTGRRPALKGAKSAPCLHTPPKDLLQGWGSGDL